MRKKWFPKEKICNEDDEMHGLKFLKNRDFLNYRQIHIQSDNCPT
ncbi:hypothetical protein Y693_11325 [Bacillus anthracis str. 95014]|nr:hypothetical protein Y693_11325 [Bacillus anthracis str. 95014]